MSINTKLKQNQLINDQILNCTKCSLYKKALNPVFGNGNLNTKIIFIGEAPGKNEDEQGYPFVGRSGKLLDQLLESINLSRDEIWIGNVIKHRPPKNRQPTRKEIKVCSTYLFEQINLIQPLLIVTLGRYAYNFFNSTGMISKDHGKLQSIDKRLIFPVYHPAAALRSSKMRDTLQQDFKKILNIYADLNLI